MSWDDAALLESALKSALDTFNWPEAEAICQRIIGRIMTEPDLIPEATAKRLPQNLRRKRRLNLMTSLADAMVQSGLRSPQVRRQYAQALIDQGPLGAGEIIGLILEGPNPYIPGHVNEYGPNGYMTLEFNGQHLNEIVHAPDGSVAYARELA
jgi:hypothetical protein